MKKRSALLQQAITKQHSINQENLSRSGRDSPLPPSYTVPLTKSLSKTQGTPLQQISENQQHHNLNLVKKETLKKLKLAIVIQKIEHKNEIQGEPLQLLFDLLSEYSFFQKINKKNTKIYRELMKYIEIQRIPKGKIIQMLGQRAQKTYFVLKGLIGVYVKVNISHQKIKIYKQQYGEDLHIDTVNKNPLIKKKSMIIQQEHAVLSFLQRKKKQYQKIFDDEQQIISWFPDLTRVSCIKAQQSIDQIALKKNIHRVATMITQQDTILISISKTNFLEVVNRHQSLNIILEERIQQLKKFKIFNSWEKRLNINAVYFQRKVFKRGEIVYKQGDPAQSFYLIIEGQVEMTVEIIKNSDEQKKQKQPKKKISVNIFGKESYFGEQQLLNKCDRITTTQAVAAYTQVLYLSKKNFFLLGYETDFFYQLRQNLKLKTENRQKLIKKSLKIYDSFKKEKTPEKLNFDYKFLLNKKQKNYKYSKINNHKPSVDLSQNKIVCLHGNRILNYKNQDSDDENQLNSFIMLQSNQEMYEATLKKFRRFHKKPATKIKSEVDWNMKRVWKVLNLDELLTQQNPMRKDPEAIKYFYKHNRLLNQISESRTLRPKTSSSSYKQKIKYVNYLHEFNQIAKERKFSVA